MISQELLREYFDYRDGELIWKKKSAPQSKMMIGSVAGCLDKRHGYWCIMFLRKPWRRSRLVWIFHRGEIPDGKDIDHRNRIRDDDRIENLRDCTPRQNQHNRLDQSKHGIGVKYHPECKVKPFRAVVRIGGKDVHLGYFPTPEEAQAAYRNTLSEIGEVVL